MNDTGESKVQAPLGHEALRHYPSKIVATAALPEKLSYVEGMGLEAGSDGRRKVASAPALHSEDGRKSQTREAVVIRNLKSRYGVFGAALLVLSLLLAACGGTRSPGNGTEQTLTVTKVGTGGGTVTGPQIACGDDCTGSYAQGTAVVLTATPADGATFAGWGGDCAGTTCELVMDGDKTVTAAFEEADDVPASALGDSPTVTGTIANLGRGDFAGKALELKAGYLTAVPEDVLAASPVADDGSFSLQIPGEAEMTPRLFDGRPEIFLGGTLGCDVTLAPEVFKTASAQDFSLFVDGQLEEQVIQISASNPYILVVYLYVDRDVRATGACASGDFAGLETDIDMRAGWNTVVLDLTALTFRNEDLSAGYPWVIPSLCNPDGECPAD